MVTSNRAPLAAALAAAALFLAAPIASADPAAGQGALPKLSDERAPVARPAASSPPAPGVAPTPAPAPQVLGPEVHHAPVASAKAGESLLIRASIERPHLLKMAYVIYKTEGKWFTLKLLRTSEEDYAGTIPAEHVRAPGLGYAIEMEYEGGTRAAVFASRDELQPIVVHDDAADERERWLLDRLSQRRSVASITGEYVNFGTTDGDHPIACSKAQEGCKNGQITPTNVQDQYWRAEGSYTYRPLRAVSEFGFRLGVVRGRSLVDLETYDPKKYDVGLNYAGANVRFRLASIFHADLEFLGSVTEIGFSAGAGAAVIFGDPLATKFTLGWQTIGFTSQTYFGTRFYTRLDIPAGSRVTIAPSVEVTDMPHAESFGVRLLADAGFVVGRGFSVWVRGGYQARISRSGGPALGATAQLAF